MTDEVNAAAAPGGFRVLAIGEILWDVFPEGSQLGGAPLNFALHAAALCAGVQVVSRVGGDPLGARVFEVLADRNVDLGLLQADPAHPTGTAVVGRQPNGDPHFTLTESVAWDFIEAAPEALAAAARADAIYFGSLAQRHPVSRQAIRRLIAAARPAALRVFDVNLRPPFVDKEIVETSLSLATVLKINETELAELGCMFGINATTPADLATGLADRFQLDTIACTLGGKGSFLLHHGRVDECAPSATTVLNTVGAGDSFTAVLTVGLLAGVPLDVIGRRANDVAAFVCTQPGGTPILPANLREPFCGKPNAVNDVP